MFSYFFEVVKNCGKDKNYSVLPIIPGMHCTKGTFIIKQTQVKHILINFMSSLLLTSPLFGQNSNFTSAMKKWSEEVGNKVGLSQD